jgi:hypothetical protein
VVKVTLVIHNIDICKLIVDFKTTSMIFGNLMVEIGFGCQDPMKKINMDYME